MTEEELAERRLALEERKTELEAEVAQARMALDQRQIGRFSSGAVTLIGAAIAVVSAVATTTIGGLFGAQNNASNNAAQQQLAREEVEGQLNIKRTEVEGQIRVQELVASAERDRLEIEQKFEIITQATKGLPPDVASENLKFFVEAGILEDPEGKIRALVEQGRAPDLPAVLGQQRGDNPLLERVAQLNKTPPSSKAPSVNGRFSISEGILRSDGSATIDYVETPNHGDEITPQYVVFHYTGGVGPGVLRMLTENVVKASAHLLLQRDGTIVQLLPLDRKAWHVGRSNWGSLSSLNKDTIGIEMENLGLLQRNETGWVTWNGDVVPGDQVFVDTDGSGWHAFTDEQVAVAQDILATIAAADPKIIDVLGHADLSPGRKADPGPAFPIETLRAAVFDRRDPLPPLG